MSAKLVVRNPKNSRILKNPEKYLQSLHAKIANLEYRNSLLRSEASRLRGQQIVSWVTGIIDNEDTTKSCDLLKFNAGDKIAVIGRVKSVSASKCSTGNLQSKLEFERIETRKVPEDF